MPDPSEHPAEYTGAEELLNSLSHGLGAVLSVAGLLILIISAVLHGTVWHIVSFCIFGSTLVLLYGVSALYHGIPPGKTKHFLRVLDHSAVYLLIAGSYTPFMLVSLRGPWGWSILSVIWLAAVLGIVLKRHCFARFEKASVIMYVAMGWLCLLASKQIVMHVPALAIGLLVLGGLAYTVGVLFYRWETLPFNHGIWHLFVLIGSMSHFFSVLCIL